MGYHGKLGYFCQCWGCLGIWANIGITCYFLSLLELFLESVVGQAINVCANIGNFIIFYHSWEHFGNSCHYLDNISMHANVGIFFVISIIVGDILGCVVI